MAKLDSIGVRAKDIDRIFEYAIGRIAEGKDEFSCCAIATIYSSKDKLKVRRFYVEVLGPRPHATGYNSLLTRVLDHVGNNKTDESQGFRILMLSLAKAAWRDLV